MKKLWWIFLYSLTIITWAINNFSGSNFIENFYYNLIYQAIRKVYNNTIYHLPFAFSYIVLPVLITLIIYFIIKGIKSLKSRAFILGIQYLSLPFFVIYILFYFLWGFNYKLNSLEARINLENVKIDTLDVFKEAQYVTGYLEKLRNQITIDTQALDIKYRPHDLMDQIKTIEKEILYNWGFKTNFDIRIRAFYPKGSLLVFTTAGIYNPFSFEGHYDPGLSHIQSTFVIAHEMAHGYGVTNEADCNFIALLTCLKSENKYIKYTGLLTYWRYLMSELRDKAPFSFYKLAYLRPIGLRNDIAALYKELDKYPDIMPNFREWLYDKYLKSNGIGEGIVSYDRVTNLVFAYKKKYGNIFNELPNEF